MKSTKIFAVAAAIMVGLAVAGCKSEGEKLADDYKALMVKAEKAMDSGDVEAAEKLGKEAEKIMKQAGQLSKEEQKKFEKAIDE